MSDSLTPSPVTLDPPRARAGEVVSAQAVMCWAQQIRAQMGAVMAHDLRWALQDPEESGWRVHDFLPQGGSAVDRLVLHSS